MNVAYQESYIAYRKKYDKVFKAHSDDETISLGDGYTVHSRTYSLSEENVNYRSSENAFLDRNGKVLYSWRNIESDAEFFKLIHHKNGRHYLLFRCDLYGYGVYELESGKDFLYVPAFYEDKKHDFFETFIWTDVQYDEKNSCLAVFGCYWGGSYTLIFLDFSDPLREISAHEWYCVPDDYDYEEVQWENGALYFRSGELCFTSEDIWDKIKIKKAYVQLIEKLYAQADAEYRDFHKKLLKNENIHVMGVRVPALRKMAKEYKGEIENLLSFPNEYYEVTFLKCCVAGRLPYKEFIQYVDRLVPLLDNWATCDCFQAPCIKKHRDEFLPYIERYLSDGREFVVRYGLTTLLHYYVEEKYLPVIFRALRGCGEEKYYIMMAAAWLFAEVLVKDYEAGVRFLQEGCLPVQISNKAIQKARESFRLSPEQKKALVKFKK